MKPEPDLEGSIRKDDDTFLKTMARSDYVIAAISPYQGKKEVLKVLKNRHDGKVGNLNANESIELLIKLISRFAFDKTSGLGLYEGMFEKELTEFVKNLVDKYGVKEEAISHLKTLKEMSIL